MSFLVDETKDSTCYVKAKRNGEDTFTLRSQDKTAPRTILFWIMENIETASDEKLREAFEDAIKMRAWPKRKMPD